MIVLEMDFVKRFTPSLLSRVRRRDGCGFSWRLDFLHVPGGMVDEFRGIGDKQEHSLALYGFHTFYSFTFEGGDDYDYVLEQETLIYEIIAARLMELNVDVYGSAALGAVKMADTPFYN